MAISMTILKTWLPTPSTVLLLPILCLKLRIKDQRVRPFSHPNSSHHAPATAAQMTLKGVSTLNCAEFSSHCETSCTAGHTHTL